MFSCSLKNGTTMENWIGESFAILFSKVPFQASSDYEAIVYQANPQRCDKISQRGGSSRTASAIHKLVQPKSSTLTIRFFAACPALRFATVLWDSYSLARPREFVPLTVFALNSSMAYQRQKCP